MSRPLLATTLLVLFLLAGACGGSGGGGGGGPNPPPPPPGDDPPTVALLSPGSRGAEIAGTSMPVFCRVDDDKGASVRMFLDKDGNVATTGDQTVLFTGVLPLGIVAFKRVPIPAGLGPGRTTFYVEANDGANAPVRAPGVDLLLYAGVAGVAPPRSNAYAVTDEFVFFSQGEAEDGGAPLNGDGIADDGVIVGVRTTDGGLAPTGWSTDVTSVPLGGIPRILPVKGTPPVVAWTLREQDEGIPLNGDGDTLDPILMLATPSVSPIPIPVLNPSMTRFPTASHAQFFALAREALASLDLNGDGDQLDDVFHVIPPGGVIAPYAADTPAPGTPFVAAPSGTLAAYRVDEGIQGTGNAPGFDLNGDLDALDILLAVVDGLGGRLAFAGADPSQMPPQRPRNVDPGAAFAVSDAGWVGYYVDEGFSSALPLNLDADTTDFIPAIYDAQNLVESMPGTGLNAGPSARFFFLEGDLALYTASEEGLVDRNGDGDMLDTEVLYFTNAQNAPATATPLSTGVGSLTGIALDGGSAARLGDGWVAFVANEVANLDLNADGDTSDAILFLVDLRGATPVVTNTLLSPLPTGALAGSTIPATGVGGEDGVIAQGSEVANGDLNDDGDINDTLLFFFAYANPSVRVALPETGGMHAANVGQRIAVTANEALTGVDFDQSGDALGFVLRVFDLSGQVLEPGRTCHPVSVPTSRSGALWAWLRSELGEATDLNGDGDQADVVLGLWRH